MNFLGFVMILEDCDDFSSGRDLFSGLVMILEDCYGLPGGREVL
jgi:hypothetical protein